LSITTTSPAVSVGPNPCSSQATNAAASIAPSTAMLSRMPPSVSAATTVVLRVWLRGAYPYARCPRGAQAYSGVMRVCVPRSSTKTNRPAGMAAVSSRQRVRAASSRSLAISDFFYASTRPGGASGTTCSR